MNRPNPRRPHRRPTGGEVHDQIRLLVVEPRDLGASPYATQPRGGERDWIRAWQQYGAAVRNRVEPGTAVEAVHALYGCEWARLTAGVAAALPWIDDIDAAERNGLIVAGALVAAFDLVLSRRAYGSDADLYDRAARIVQIHWCAGAALVDNLNDRALPTDRVVPALRAIANSQHIDASDRLRLRRSVAALPAEVHALPAERRLACLVRIVAAAARGRREPLGEIVAEAMRAGTHSALVEAYRHATRRRSAHQREQLHNELYASIVPFIIGDLERAARRHDRSRDASVVSDLAADCANDGWMALVTRIDIGQFEPMLSLTGNPVESFVRQAARRAFTQRDRELRNRGSRHTTLTTIEHLPDQRAGDVARRAEDERFLEASAGEFLRVIDTMLKHPRRGRAAQALRLRHTEGLTAAEIAERLDLREANARQLVHRAMIWWREAALQDPRARAWLATQYGDVLTPAIDTYFQQVRSGLRSHSRAVCSRFIGAVEPALRDRFTRTANVLFATEQLFDAAWKERPLPELSAARERFGAQQVVQAMVDTVRSDLGPTTAEITSAFYGVAPSPWSPARRTPTGILDISRDQGPRPTAVLTSLVRAAHSVERLLDTELH